MRKRVLYAGTMALVLVVAGFVAYTLGTQQPKPGSGRSGLLATVDDDVRIPSPLSAEDIDRALEAIGAAPMVGLGRAFKDAEAEYGINAVFLAAIAVHESGRGYSRLAIEKSNLFGWGAVDHSPFDGAHHFESWEHGIHHVASVLRREYVDARQLTTIQLIGARYATDPLWAEKVVVWAKRIQDKAAGGHDR